MTATAQFLYRLRPTRPALLIEGPTFAECDTLAEHLAYLDELSDRGIVILAGRTQNADESAFGIVILQAESEEAARTVMAEDPAVRDGVMTAELFPYRVAVQRTA